MNNSARWKCAAWGLWLKWIALWILLVSPLLVLGAAVARIPILKAAGAMLLAAFLVDAVGRVCGLVTPGVRRWPILLSATAQCSGLIFAAVLVIILAENEYETVIGISLAAIALVVAQVVAAYLFTLYLADVAEQLGEPQWAERCNQLRTKISRNIAAASGMTSVVIMLAMMTLIGGIVTCGIGFYILLPLDALVLLGFMPLWIPVAWQMFGEYGRILAYLRTRIYSPSVSPFKTANPLASSEIIFLPPQNPFDD